MVDYILELAKENDIYAVIAVQDGAIQKSIIEDCMILMHGKH
ncbi:hypothetical protein [uncultured Succiniclasticum sp.]|nr:hypothetical protein [uncultured Succiniclasticum sp.]